MSKRKRTPKKATKKRAPKKAAKRKAADPLKVSGPARKSGRPPAPERPPRDGGEEWGDPILVGSVGPVEVTIRPPINEAAARACTQEQLILLILEHKITKAEKALERLERELEIFGRLARIEAALELEPG